MTDVDRSQKVDLGVLIAELRHAERPLCDMAADELERLAARVQKLEQELELVLDEKRFAND
jgi:HAMP domain-containing protein